MAKVTAHRKGDNITESNSISFSKDPETGLFKKIEQGIKSYHKEHKTKTAGKQKVSEELYCLGDESNWDYMFEVSGPDDKQHTIYFKKFIPED
tara:strand:- start:109 stop:387 length:279 start_codon:yes stop_codon:yes gene_type:complete